MNDPQTYRHRTAEIQAMQWTGSNAEQMRAFVGATLALVLCVVAFSVGPLVAPGVKAARNRLSARLPAERAPQASPVPQARKRRPTPSWAHEQPTRYEEAA